MKRRRRKSRPKRRARTFWDTLGEREAEQLAFVFALIIIAQLILFAVTR